MLRPYVYSIGALLCGCATPPRELPPPPPKPQPPVLSMARVEVHSDVAIIPADVEYVLYPQPSEPAPTVAPLRPATPATASIAQSPVVPVKMSTPVADSSKNVSPPAVKTTTNATPASAAPSTPKTDTPSITQATPAATAVRVAAAATPVAVKAPPTGAAPAPAPILSTPTKASSTEILDAWRKYCHADTEISPAEWALIDSTTVPAELAKVWAKECVPQK
jgi:hypothetical protein